MKKNEHIEFLKGAVVFIAFGAIAIAVGLVANRVLEAVGITTYISVEPYINNKNDVVDSSLTGPGWSALIFGFAIAWYFGTLWLMSKFKRWLVAAFCSVLTIIFAWVLLASALYLLDFVFGYEDGWHQGLANVIFIILNAAWLFISFITIKWIHQFFKFSDSEAKSEKSQI